MSARTVVTRSTAPRYPISVVARRVGISEITLRAWERRYQAVSPARTDGRQRHFSEADVERLVILKALTRDGTAISALATMSTAELRRMAPLAAREFDETPQIEPVQRSSSLSRELAACTKAVAALDADRLQQLLMRHVLERGPLAFIEQIASPLCAWIGDEWSRGKLTEAQEHAASEILRRVFGFMLQTLRRDRGARHVVLTTLAGEKHEFGAMMAGIIAALDGWSYTYLGPDLPATAIASAVKKIDARLIAVSIIAPRAKSQPARELVALRHAIGKRVDIVIGGPSAASVEHVLVETRAVRVNSLGEWRDLLATRTEPN